MRTLVARSALLVFVPAMLPAQNPADLPAHLGATKSAKPFSVHQKLDYRVIETFGVRGAVGSALSAAISQANDTPHAWGQGFGGFATRYASSFGGNLGRQSMAFALESALHEDPRYFPSEERGFKARFKNVLLQTVVTRTDSGGHRFAYSRMISAFANGQLVNAWQPPSNGSVADGLTRGVITLGSDLGYNFLQEFVPFMRPRTLRKN